MAPTTHGTITLDLDELAAAIVRKLDETEGVEAYAARMNGEIPIFSRRAKLEDSIAALKRRIWEAELERNRAKRELQDTQADLRTACDERDEFREQLDEAVRSVRVEKPAGTFQPGDLVRVIDSDSLSSFDRGDVLKIVDPIDDDGEYYAKPFRNEGERGAEFVDAAILGAIPAFNDGDRVKITGNRFDPAHYANVGDVGVVSRERHLSDQPAAVLVTNLGSVKWGQQWIDASDLELVVDQPAIEAPEIEEPAPAYAVGDRVRVDLKSHGTLCAEGEIVVVVALNSDAHGTTTVRRVNGDRQWLAPETLSKVEPRTFQHPGEIPDDVEAVRDCGGSVWAWGSRRGEAGHDVAPWKPKTALYAPFVEVFAGE